MNIIIYDDTGKILRTASIVGDPAKQLMPGEKYIEGTADDTKYIENGVVVDIPANPGQFYSFDFITKKWILDTVGLEASIIAKRDWFLSSTDWSQAPDINPDVKQKYAEYRQLLKDIPQQPGYPGDIVWPTAPKQN
jgi:hypothetical protein